MADVGRITHIGVEVLRVGDPKARITQTALEILRQQAVPDARITHIGIEVLRVNEAITGKGNFFLCF